MFALPAAARFAHFAAICTLFGTVGFPFYAGEMPPRLRRMVRICGVLALVTGVAELLAAAANMGDSWRAAFDPVTLSAAITDTAFGRVWVGRLVLAAVVVGLGIRRRAKHAPMLMASGVLLASVALTGHSVIAGGAIGVLHRLADGVHLLAAGCWIGGLVALLLTVHALGDRLPIVLGRFSRIGYVAVALMIASGIIKRIILVVPLSALWTSAYGYVLLITLALFCGMGGLALSNRFQISPALATGIKWAQWTAMNGCAQ